MRMRKKLKPACLDVLTVHVQTTQPVDGKNIAAASKGAKKFLAAKGFAASVHLTFQGHNIEEMVVLALDRDLTRAIVSDLAQLKITMRVTLLVCPLYSTQYKFISRYLIHLVVMLKKH